MIEDFNIVRLTPDYAFKPFECDDTDLYNFLMNDSKQALEDLNAVTYIFESNYRILAYCSLLNDRISREETSNGKWKKIIRKFSVQYGSYPAVKLGRLAVHQDIQGMGLGRKIIDFLRLYFIDKNKTGCRFITVDAYRDSLSFYDKCGFIYFSDRDAKADTRQMYFDLKSIK